MKQCTACKQSKPLAEFVRSSRSPGGRSSWCLRCHADSERRRRQSDPVRAKASDRRQYLRKRAKPGFLEAKRIANRARSTESRSAQHYRGQHPGVAEDYIRTLLTDPCSYCGRAGGAIDHIVASSAGGENGWENLTGCCRSCNPAKSNKPLLVFLAHRNGCWEYRQDIAA